MTQDQLQTEFNNYKEKFDDLKNSIEKQVVKTESYKGVYYETLPFSYQRVGLKRGTPADIENSKKTEDFYIYGFDGENRIIEIKEGISVPREFYYQFLFFEDDMVKALSFENSKALQNISFYVLDENGKAKIVYSKGRRGGKEEHYHYSENKLDNILIRQFDRNGNEANSLQHQFEYNSDGSLKTIVKLGDKGEFIETIYPQK